VAVLLQPGDTVLGYDLLHSEARMRLTSPMS
jgi:hypothetical protein